MTRFETGGREVWLTIDDGPTDDTREILDVTLSFDHDIVDGAPAARFASDFRALLEAAAALDASTPT